MQTRKHVHEEQLPAPPDTVFALLHTPSAIREWWSAARAVVLPREGGLWIAAWGADEDHPDYIAVARLRVFDPPRRLVFADYEYIAKSGPLPFKADLTTEFSVSPAPSGTILRVVQDGFPTDTVADDFYHACQTGWRDTFAGIRRFIETRSKSNPPVASIRKEKT